MLLGRGAGDTDPIGDTAPMHKETLETLEKSLDPENPIHPEVAASSYDAAWILRWNSI